MQKWEYCTVVGFYIQGGDLETFFPAAMHFTAKGLKIVEIKKPEHLEVALAIAQLGEEGWEMVGCGNTGAERHCLYFKRPLPK